MGTKRLASWAVVIGVGGSAAMCACNQPSSSALPTAKFEVTLVDDEQDPFGGVKGQALPAGLAILGDLRMDNISNANHHYARLVLQPHETFAQAKARIEPWLKALTLPQGERLVWQPLEDELDSRGNAQAYRTYLLQKEPFLWTGHIERATVIESKDRRPAVGLVFFPNAATRLEEVTRKHVGERMAIIVDDVARCVPRIEGAINNGMVQVTMGDNDYDRAQRDAKDLAQALIGH